MKRVLIKCDYGHKIGMGHLSRCISIAREIQKSGHEPIFIANRQNQFFLVKHDLQYISLDNNENDLTTEADNINSVIEHISPDCVLIDSHNVSYSYLKRIEEACPVAYIEDELKNAYPVHLLINGHIYARRSDYQRLYSLQGIRLPQLLLGPKYMPLNESYSQHFARRGFGDQVETTLIFLAGGSDPEHVTVKLLKYINSLAASLPYKLLVIVGVLNEDYEEIETLAKGNTRLTVYCGESDFKNIFSKVDIAVSAAGITLYELAACGVPTIAYSLADNQIIVGKAFQKKGICKYIGDVRNDKNFFRRLFSELEILMGNCDAQIEMSKNGLNTVDGKGCIRVANELASNWDFIIGE